MQENREFLTRILADARHGCSLSWCILGEPTSFRTSVKGILAWFVEKGLEIMADFSDL
jgi:hypothetical protein